MEKKKVLFVINSALVNAGVPHVVMSIVRELHKKFVFDVLTYGNGPAYFDEEFQSYGGKIYSVNLEKNPHLQFIRFFQLKRIIKSLVQENKYDILHCHNGTESGICLMEAAKLGVKINISHAHGQYNLPGRLVNKLYVVHCKNLIEKYANIKLSCSNLAGNTLFNNGQFINISNPFDYDYFSTLGKKNHKGINLVQIGYFAGVKNQLFSLEILREVKKNYPNVKLRFIGFINDKVYYERVLKFTQKYDLIDNVEFHPGDVDKKDIIEGSDFSLIPSVTEGLSLVALESQASGLCCLLSRGVPEDVNYGLCFYPGTEPKEWAFFIVNKLGKYKKNIDIDLRLSRLSNVNYSKTIEAVYNNELKNLYE